MRTNRIKDIQVTLDTYASTAEKQNIIFFKTGPGDYAEHDKFKGISVPILRKLAKQHYDLSPTELQTLIKSQFNEERLLALFILVKQYQLADNNTCEDLYSFYISNIKYVNNWNLVDASAHLIVGAHLVKKNKKFLLELAKSDIIWERRIAIVATWHFIRNNELNWTFKLAKLLIKDKHDLIHKAVGWMLREAGKRDQSQLIEFLDLHHTKMPRTMLRYAIEKFPEPQRKEYLLYA